MDLNGTVVTILPEQRFNGKNGEVVKNFFVLQTKEQYPQKIKFEVFGEDKWKQTGVAVGQDVSVQFDIKGAEWQGKYFVNLQAWKVTAIDNGQQQAQQQQQQVQYQAPQTQIPQDGSHVDNDSLPF